MSTLEQMTLFFGVPSDTKSIRNTERLHRFDNIMTIGEYILDEYRIVFIALKRCLIQIAAIVDEYSNAIGGIRLLPNKKR